MGFELFVILQSVTFAHYIRKEFMETKYVFMDEHGTDITGIAAPYNIGDRIINVNGEWVCEGIVSEINTKEIQPTFFEKCFGYSKAPHKTYKLTFILKRLKKQAKQR